MAQVSCGMMKFDGTDDTVAFADNAAYDVAEALSVHMWYLRDYADSTSVLLSAASRLSIQHAADNTLKVTVSGVTPVYFTRGFPKQCVHCVSVVIYESGTDLVFEMYYNGVLYEKTVVETAAMPAATNTGYYIGSTAGSSNFFKGRMSQLLMTGDRMTATEVAAQYALGRMTQDVALQDEVIFGIPFNEGTGTSLDNDGVAGLDGTAAGTPVWVTGYGINLNDNPCIVRNQNDEYYGPLKVGTYEWYSPTTAGHLLEMTDWAGAPWAKDACAVAYAGNGQKLVADWVEGIKVSDLDSGYVIIRLM